jgi:hypothetical protein
MRILLIIPCLALAACAETGPKVAGGNRVASVTYYDFNGDGRADFELHFRPLINGVVGYEWARRDTDYDGYYDEQIDYGATIALAHDIHIPVPRMEFSDSPQPKRPNQTMERTPGSVDSTLSMKFHPCL